MVAPHDSAASSTNVTPADALRLSLACPRCGAKGWIKWTSLNRGIHCPKCKCEFLVGRTGQLHAMRDLPQTRFSCPRCGKSGSIPSTLVVQKAECGDCKLPLVQGPDQRLHGVKEAAELRAAQARQVKPTYAQWLKENLRDDQGGLSKARLVVGAGLLLTITLGLGVLVEGLLDSSVETQARRFTARCAAGDWKYALRSVSDDDVQVAEFERWRMRHFTSIIEKYRPAGDRVSIEVSLFGETARGRRLQVAMTSPFLGTRTINQVWCEQGGQWRFDVVATLHEEDSPVSRPTAAAHGKAAATR